MKRTLFSVFALTLLASSVSFAATNVKITPTHPINCEQAYDAVVAKIPVATYSEDESTFRVHLEITQEICKSGRNATETINESADRAVVLMHDGFKTPWNYKAPGTLVTEKVETAMGDRLLVDMEFDKAELFEKSSERDFTLVVVTRRGMREYVYGFLIRQAQTPGGATQLLLSTK